MYLNSYITGHGSNNDYLCVAQVNKKPAEKNQRAYEKFVLMKKVFS